jgi:hypothetical protein
MQHITMRSAGEGDAAALAEIAITAAHGILSMMYGGLVPGSRS